MLKYLINTILYNDFEINKYKNILELIPKDNRHIEEKNFV